LLLALALIAAARAPVKVLGGRAAKNAPRGWSLGDRAHANQKVTFHLALKQRNLDKLEEKFWAVATPTNPQYREFMTIDEIDALVSPPKEDVAHVVSYLLDHGVPPKGIENYGDSIFVTTKTTVAEKLLHTRFHYWHNDQSGKAIVRIVGSFGIDAAIAPYVEMVAGVTEFPIPRPTLKKAQPDPNVPNVLVAICPQSVNTIYKVPSGTTTSGNTSIAVAEWESQYFSPKQLQQFAKQFAIPIPPLTSDHIVGTNDASNPGIEATLDIQYANSLSPGATAWFWIEDPSAWLYTFATHVVRTSPAPWIYSISYGWSEADQCEFGIGGQECQKLGVNSVQYVQRVNTEFQKIGLRGISLFSASGDSGANGRTDPDCVDPILHPDYPGCSPYVTAVGATQITQGSGVAKLPSPPPGCSGQSCASAGIEVAVSYNQAQFASGGGFSWVAATPSYQQSVVSSYLSSAPKLPPSNMYNGKGRGYPDIAAFGSNVLIESGGIEAVGGTSCSCPICAGLFAMLNGQVIQKTGKPLGFLNPLIYQMAAAQPATFSDITVGNNICTEGGCASSCKGFQCTKGWDPVTGLGTPVYTAIQQYLANQFDYSLDD